MTIKIGKISLGARPAIVVTVSGKESRLLLKKAKRLGARIFELRIDRFPSLKENFILKKIRFYRGLGLPLIATIRRREEGGGRRIPEAKRLELFKKVLPWVEAVDLELASKKIIRALTPLAHRKGKRVIVSYHNFKGTPSDGTLRSTIEKGKRAGADLVKIAVTPKKEGDVGRLLLLTHRNKGRGIVSIAMGAKGQVTRFLAPLFGSPLTYSFAGRPQAPGQLRVDKLAKKLKSVSLNP